MGGMNMNLHKYSIRVGGLLCMTICLYVYGMQGQQISPDQQSNRHSLRVEDISPPDDAPKEMAPTLFTIQEEENSAENIHQPDDASKEMAPTLHTTKEDGYFEEEEVGYSEEEEVARDFICFNKYDLVIVVCDAVCLERNLNLVLQTLEITKKVIVCVNLMDEAKKKKINIDLTKLSNILGVPVVGTSARNKNGINELLNNLENTNFNSIEIKYDDKVEEAIDILLPYLKDKTKDLNPRWVAINLINYEESLYKKITNYLNYDLLKDKIIKNQLIYIKEEGNYNVVDSLIKKSEEIAKKVVTYENKNYKQKDLKIDKITTSKLFGIPLIITLLMVIFWLTIKGANYPSELLFQFFSYLEIHILNFLEFLKFPQFLINLLISGVYKVLTWVVAVMLPPMAIFFPLFTLLEDLGYLPRIAFNLDKMFKKCCACGKQALTMCMGFGCNAVGVSGARIIDSPRERLIAILTNVFVPCNGRFPTMITLITIFFVGINGSSFLSVIILTLVILLGFLLTFLVSYILSKTILKGVPSSFTLELPPYRKPQVGKVIIRSIFDRTLFVLSRAVIVAVPAGALIWLLANLHINDISLLNHISSFLDPFGKLIGMDGVILISFILGFPANEIVIPIMLMTYMATGNLVEYESLESLRTILVNNGWTVTTAICVLIFSLCHFPCSTTCLTIKKETGSLKWTLLAIIIPTLIGIILCFLINNISNFI